MRRDMVVRYVRGMINDFETDDGVLLLCYLPRYVSK